MALLDRIKDAVGVGVGDDEDLTHYHCRNCGRNFEAAEESPDRVRCPSCRASGEQAIDRRW